AEATETTAPIGVSNLRRDTASVLGVFCFKTISKNNKNRSECLNNSLLNFYKYLISVSHRVTN
ncbi:MAG TPA: hypothetical protein DCQ26_06965, partial [Marinilabiliales bacterium]|nr:hypothetical protein [Marinilabiliales bacterium]HBX83108.1 hypothetical protein [Marinilabiliales bacterium]